VDCGAASCEVLELGKFLGGRGETDVEAVGFADPALLSGFCDPGDQVITDALQSWPLGRVGAKQWAADAAVRGCRVFHRPGHNRRGRLCGVRSGRGIRPIPHRWGCGIPGKGAARGGGR